MATQRTGYSGRPLYKKLGIKEEYKVQLIQAPEEYFDWLEIPFALDFEKEGEIVNFVHLFSKEKDQLEQLIATALPQLAQNGMIWVSWPKKASKVVTDVTEDVIRSLIFPHGLVDVKVCSVSNIWSGLKVVIRKENRTS